MPVFQSRQEVVYTHEFFKRDEPDLIRQMSGTGAGRPLKSAIVEQKKAENGHGGKVVASNQPFDNRERLQELHKQTLKNSFHPFDNNLPIQAVDLRRRQELNDLLRGEIGATRMSSPPGLTSLAIQTGTAVSPPAQMLLGNNREMIETVPPTLLQHFQQSNGMMLHSSPSHIAGHLVNWGLTPPNLAGRKTEDAAASVTRTTDLYWAAAVTEQQLEKERLLLAKYYSDLNSIAANAGRSPVLETPRLGPLSRNTRLVADTTLKHKYSLQQQHHHLSLNSVAFPYAPRSNRGVCYKTGDRLSAPEQQLTQPAGTNMKK